MSATPLALELLEKEIYQRQERLDDLVHGLSFAKANLDDAIKRLEPIQAQYDRELEVIAARREELAQYQAEAAALRSVVNNPVAEALDELEPSAEPEPGLIANKGEGSGIVLDEIPLTGPYEVADTDELLDES